MKKEELRYLERLAELYPTIGKASTEIINLQSILNLPKGTEHFMSDLHGEYEAFSHVLRNGSGAVRKKINDVFGHTLSNSDKRALATLIYYPREKIQLVKKTEEDMENWYKDHSVPADRGVQDHGVQVHPFQSPQSPSARLRLRDRGTDHREGGSAGQRGIL